MYYGSYWPQASYDHWRCRLLRLSDHRSRGYSVVRKSNSSYAQRCRPSDGRCCFVIPSFPQPINAEPDWYDSYIFLLFYGCGIDVAGVVFYSEIFPNHLRAKGVALAIATIALTDLVYLQATATAFANIGWKFFLVRSTNRSAYPTLVY